MFTLFRTQMNPVIQIEIGSQFLSFVGLYYLIVVSFRQIAILGSTELSWFFYHIAGAGLWLLLAHLIRKYRSRFFSIWVTIYSSFAVFDFAVWDIRLPHGSVQDVHLECAVLNNHILWLFICSACLISLIGVFRHSSTEGT